MATLSFSGSFQFVVIKTSFTVESARRWLSDMIYSAISHFVIYGLVCCYVLVCLTWIFDWFLLTGGVTPRWTWFDGEGL